jgi:hypothetical protein
MQKIESAGKIENGKVVWTEIRNRVWTVRAGTDGIGIDLFHVYAGTMDEARRVARDNAAKAGFVFGDRFTVHAVRDWDTDEAWCVRLGNNVVTDRPAIDFEV